MKKSKRIDKKESWSYKSVLRTRKSLFREELRDKEETRKLLRLLPMKTKTLQNWKWEKASTFRSCGTHSWERKWSVRWEPHNQLMKLLKQSKQLLALPMSKKWLRSFWLGNRPIPSYWWQSLTVREKLISWRRTTRSWEVDFTN